ncbi:hypothetical protein ACC754_43290, partial [Rhizobium johnstonii]
GETLHQFGLGGIGRAELQYEIENVEKFGRGLLFGRFPILRFYSPTEAYFDKSWKLEEIKAVKQQAGFRREIAIRTQVTP